MYLYTNKNEIRCSEKEKWKMSPLLQEKKKETAIWHPKW